MGQSRRFDPPPVTSDLPQSTDVLGVSHHFAKVPSMGTHAPQQIVSLFDHLIGKLLWVHQDHPELFQFKFDELDASSADIAQRAYCTGLLAREITKLEDHLLVGMLRLTFNNVPPV
jgi:hypothetical protein